MARIPKIKTSHSRASLYTASMKKVSSRLDKLSQKYDSKYVLLTISKSRHVEVFYDSTMVNFLEKTRLADNIVEYFSLKELPTNVAQNITQNVTENGSSPSSKNSSLVRVSELVSQNMSTVIKSLLEECDSLDLSNQRDVRRFYGNSLMALQQTACKTIAKAWIKSVEPKKQSRFPYMGGERSRPAWWPTSVRHKEPDHLKKGERLELMTAVLQLYGIPTEQLGRSTVEFMHTLSDERALLLRTIYFVRQNVENMFEIASSPEPQAEISAVTVRTHPSLGRRDLSKEDEEAYDGEDDESADDQPSRPRKRSAHSLAGSQNKKIKTAGASHKMSSSRNTTRSAQSLPIQAHKSPSSDVDSAEKVSSRKRLTSARKRRSFPTPPPQQWPAEGYLSSPAKVHSASLLTQSAEIFSAEISSAGNGSEEDEEQSFQGEFPTMDDHFNDSFAIGTEFSSSLSPLDSLDSSSLLSDNFATCSEHSYNLNAHFDHFESNGHREEFMLEQLSSSKWDDSNSELHLSISVSESFSSPQAFEQGLSDAGSSVSIKVESPLGNTDVETVTNINPSAILAQS